MAEPVWVKSSAGLEDIAGAINATLAGCTVGNLIILQAIADGDSALTALTFNDTNNTVESLAGVANTMTFICVEGVGTAIGSSHWLWIGRVTNTNVSIDFTTAGQDTWFLVHEFTDESGGATTLAEVIENGSAGAWVNERGNSASMLDTAVVTTGPDRLALNFGAVNDDSTVAYSSFTGESGGDWILRSSYQSAVGTDSGVLMQTASMPSAGTINGGSMAMDTDPWGVIGFALISSGAGPPPEDDKFFPFI